jgi:hypothetical protein
MAVSRLKDIPNKVINILDVWMWELKIKKQ